ncbi:magnesium-translocating P-type ATPase [Prevotella cerevisiae]|uniref:Magnesium-transporting ATPase, P-type 1 n=1 Tax=Segatella cerevisiae TaxID=2053716 RepID=A0ABT1BZG6_9BACT|nr:magnesium-translocating P-type ATPase [Segatella cerevisiae]MCO6025738.1 magnesium-translocating P-type ATPase [Segatella cerevisiae]
MMWRKKMTTRYVFDTAKVFRAAMQPLAGIYSYFKTTPNGLDTDEVKDRNRQYGPNDIAHEHRKNPILLFISAFINPFTGILTALAIISFILDVAMAAPGQKNWTSVIIISGIIIISAILRFWQETKARLATNGLMKMVTNTCSVLRSGEPEQEIDICELVPGDLVRVAAGDMIPADLRIIESKDLFVGQSSLTGESEPVEKVSVPENVSENTGNVLELKNICFMGSNVISGTAKGIVFATGSHSYLGTIAKTITNKRVTTAFDKGISKVSYLLIRFMLFMIPFVFLINGFTKGDWLQAFLFAVSVAVGLTPAMLPMIVTGNLAKGAITMSKKKTIVKDLNAIQNFGAMHILCTDKTGTLTCDRIVLERYLKADGQDDEDKQVLRHAYYNSYFQTGLKNLMDQAILSHVKELGMENVKDQYTKVDEIPFDFQRRRMSVVIEDRNGKRQIITKGAVEEMLSICSFEEIKGKILPLEPERKDRAEKVSRALNQEGMRVLAVAQKSFPTKDHDFAVKDENEMVLIGFLAFLDPLKPSATEAIKQLHENGVEVKILSGDNDIIVKNVGRQVGIDTRLAITGMEIEHLTDDDLKPIVRKCKLFSKLTPLQKTRIISLLQNQGNTVGFLGDGINDASALRQADIGISVDSAVDIAKESADIILLKKDLLVLEAGVIEGRKTFGNIIKYIKMTASSNFGNMFSMMVASAFLPFLPMLPVQVLIQNFLYDISQVVIPFDRMDPEYLRKPRIWDASDLSRFMICIGPISSIFDITTFLILWYIFGYDSQVHQSFFQSGWFIEGLLSQTLIVHMIRTPKIPFLQSRATWPVTLLTLVIMAVGIGIPYTSIGRSLGFGSMPLNYFPWLFGILLAYCLTIQFVKKIYMRRLHRWL